MSSVYVLFPRCRAACATHLRSRATRRHASTGVSPLALACGFQPGGERQGTVLRREDLARPQRVSLVPKESGSGAEPANQITIIPIIYELTKLPITCSLTYITRDLVVPEWPGNTHFLRTSAAAKRHHRRQTTSCLSPLHFRRRRPVTPTTAHPPPFLPFKDSPPPERLVMAAPIKRKTDLSSAP